MGWVCRGLAEPQGDGATVSRLCWPLSPQPQTWQHTLRTSRVPSPSFLTEGSLVFLPLHLVLSPPDP